MESLAIGMSLICLVYIVLVIVISKVSGILPREKKSRPLTVFSRLKLSFSLEKLSNHYKTVFLKWLKGFNYG